MNHRAGFTLLELSVVLVIIALIIGGILVGRDLVEAAYVRATVAQIEKYKTAVNTFRTKYNTFPGDLSATTASQLGMAIRAGTAGRGDNDGALEGCSAAAVGTATIAGCETILFWNDLSVANMVDGNFVGTDGTGINMASSEDDQLDLISDAMAMPVVTLNKDTVQPRAEIQKGNYVIAYSDSGVNYFEITGLKSSALGIYTLYNALTPLEALNMDNKMDDGDPMDGHIEATEGTGPDNLATPGANTCVSSATDQYNVVLTTPLCHLRVLM
jgi:prepilin-type N-terminal cleavage/methylation domain-containing protein